MKEQITEIILLIAPSVITILSMIGIIAKVIGHFRSLKKEVVDMKEMKEVKQKLDAVIQENYELKKTLKETMSVIDRIERKEKSNGKGKEKV